MSRNLFLKLALFTVFSMTTPSGARADTCMWPRAYSRAAEPVRIQMDLRKAEVVFAGRVARVNDGFVELEVVRRWKGAQAPIIVLKDYSGDPRTYDLGRIYLVFGYRFEDHVSVDSCARVMHIEERSGRPQFPTTLGAGRPPTRPRATR